MNGAIGVFDWCTAIEHPCGRDGIRNHRDSKEKTGGFSPVIAEILVVLKVQQIQIHHYLILIK